MFEGNKYVTRGIQANIALTTQLVFWSMIEELRKKRDFEIDYLQVFDLKTTTKDGLIFQKITHRQEVEPYSNTIVIKVDEAVDSKIFVISSEDEEGKEYSTMMLAQEY